jgi:hypothetical protein
MDERASHLEPVVMRVLLATFVVALIVSPFVPHFADLLDKFEHNAEKLTWTGVAVYGAYRLLRRDLEREQ